MTTTRTGGLLLLMIGVLIAAPAAVFAHSKATSGTLTGTVYTEPHEGLMPGDPATLHVDFIDTGRSFDATKATMTIAVGKEGDTLTPAPLLAISTSTATYPYTFSEPAIYNVNVVGTTSAGTAFALSYHLEPFKNMEGGHEHDHHQLGGPFAFLGKHGAHVLIVLLLITILAAVIIPERLKERRIAQQTQDKKTENS